MRIMSWKPMQAIGATAVLLGATAASFYITFRAIPEARAPARNQRLDFNAGNRDTAKYLVKGWSAAEGWGTWSIGPTAAVRIALDAPTLENVTVKLSYRKFNAKQAITWATPGGQKPVAKSTGGKGSEVVEFRFEKDAVNRAKEIVLVAVVDPPVSPKSVGQGADDRPLGLGLEWAEIAWKPEYIYEK